MSKLKVYVASSWKNQYQPKVVKLCKDLDFEVYDFKDSKGFNWREIDAQWEHWTISQYRDIVKNHERVQEAYDRDMDALISSDICIMVNPCGASAHLELGFHASVSTGANCVYYPTGNRLDMIFKPDLMYKMVDDILIGEKELKNWLINRKNKTFPYSR